MKASVRAGQAISCRASLARGRGRSRGIPSLAPAGAMAAAGGEGGSHTRAARSRGRPTSRNAHTVVYASPVAILRLTPCPPTDEPEGGGLCGASRRPSWTSARLLRQPPAARGPAPRSRRAGVKRAGRWRYTSAGPGATADKGAGPALAPRGALTRRGTNRRPLERDDTGIAVCSPGAHPSRPVESGAHAGDACAFAVACYALVAMLLS